MISLQFDQLFWWKPFLWQPDEKWIWFHKKKNTAVCVEDLIKSEKNMTSCDSFIVFCNLRTFTFHLGLDWACQGRKTDGFKKKRSRTRSEATTRCYHWNLEREDLVFIVTAQRGIQLRFCSGRVLRESQSLKEMSGETLEVTDRNQLLMQKNISGTTTRDQRLKKCFYHFSHPN